MATQTSKLTAVLYPDVKDHDPPLRCGECHEIVTDIVIIYEDREVEVAPGIETGDTVINGYLTIPCAHRPERGAYWNADGSRNDRPRFVD